MTEAEWLSSADPGRMLNWLWSADGGHGAHRPRPSERKLRLVLHALLGPATVADWDLESPQYPDYWLNGWVLGMAGEPREGRQLARLAALLRDVVGNPFRPVVLDPALPNWCEIAGLAEAAHDERPPGGHLDPATLAILADALEDAGGVDESLLRHLRSPGPHVRGCWALDLILGRE